MPDRAPAPQAQPPDPKRAHVPILEQIDAAKAYLQDRYRVCLARVRAGDMTQQAADREIATARAIKNTLVAVAENREELAALIRAKRRRQIENEEIDQLRRNPIVRTVCDALDADVLPPGGSRPARDPARDDSPEPSPFDLPSNEEHEAA